MKRRPGQAGRIIGEAVHQIGRIVILFFILVLLSIGLIGLRLSHGPLQIPYLASKLATAVSGQGITIVMQEADLAWAGYHQGGGVPLYLRLGNISVRNQAGRELAVIPSARLVLLPAALLGSGAPILVSGTGARFSGSDVPVSLLAAIHLSTGFALGRADLLVTLGPGRLGSGDSSVPITAGGFTLSLTPRAVALSSGRLTLTPIGNSTPHLGFSGAGKLTDEWRGNVVLQADAVAAPDLPSYWPPALVPQTRKWVTTNITAGTASNAAFTFGVAAPNTLADLSLTSVTGNFTGQGITLGWIPHATPITALDGRFTMLDQDDALVTASTARLGGVALTSGQMKITGISEKLQTGLLDVNLAGTIPDTIAVLNAPPLNLLHEAPPQIAQGTGNVTARVTATIPFLNKLPLAKVQLDVEAALSNVAVNTPIAGLGFTSGTGTLEATTKGLDVTADTQFCGEPASLVLDTSFQSASILRHLTLTSRAGPALLHRLGLDAQSALADPVTGTATYSLQVTGNDADTQTATLDTDLTQAGLSIPGFAWKKAAGMPGHLAVTAQLNNGNLTNFTSISVTAPALNIQAQSQNNQIAFRALTIGRTIAHGTITAPTAVDPGWSAVFYGPVLDLRAISSPVAKNTKPVPPSNAPPTGPPWQAQLNFQQLDLAASPAPPLSGLTFNGSGVGGTLLRAEAAAGGATLSVMPTKTPLRRSVHLLAPDTGTLLKAMDAYSGLQGGGLVLDAVYGGASPTSGTLTLVNFRLMQAPAFAKVLQGMTIYGVAEATSGPGLLFDRAVAPFSIGNQTLTLSGARAFSTSLGFTASGNIALADGTANIDGTIVPAYWLNTLPGKIPIIGQLFTAEKGGGLFAVRAKITGKLTDPSISVNPLSALTPGVFRDIFGMDNPPPASANSK